MKLFGILASIFGASSPAAETKMVDPKTILFSTPTLNDALPAFQQGSVSSGKLFQMHEDDWRQFEAISSIYQDEIERELAAIRDVLTRASVKTKAADSELTAYRKVHVRKLITAPIKGGLLLSQLVALADRQDEFASLSLSGSPAVHGGYALKIDGFVAYGQVDGDRVLSLCFSSSTSPKINTEKARKLVDLLRVNQLTVVHWPSATVLEPEKDFLAFLTGIPVEEPSDFSVQTRRAFERELQKRHVPFAIQKETGRYELTLDGTQLFVSVENLQRDFAVDRDLSRVSRFIDTVLTATTKEEAALDSSRLFWCLEPNDYVEKADYRKPVSDRVDRVLVLLSGDNTRITWVTPSRLAKAGLAADAASEIAFENLSLEMRSTKIDAKPMLTV